MVVDSADMACFKFKILNSVFYLRVHSLTTGGGVLGKYINLAVIILPSSTYIVAIYF